MRKRFISSRDFSMKKAEPREKDAALAARQQAEERDIMRQRRIREFPGRLRQERRTAAWGWTDCMFWKTRLGVPGPLLRKMILPGEEGNYVTIFRFG